MAEFDVRTSFVTFVDHLPSDIIRKLWLIQSLNITYGTHRQELEDLLKERKITGPELLRHQEHLTQLRREVLEESKSIATSLKLAKMQLQNQHEQLKHDHKMHQNEVELRANMLKHSQRSNRRMKNVASPSKPTPTTTMTMEKKLSLKLNIMKLKREMSQPLRRKRGRPSKSESEMMRELREKQARELERLETLLAKAERGIDIQDFPAPKKIQLRLNPPQPTEEQTTKRSKREKKKAVKKAELEPQPQLDDDDEEGEEDDGEVYCICKGPSFGEMIACDNSKCPTEWFHYGCVGLTRAPKGKWYCPSCSKKRKR